MINELADIARSTPEDNIWLGDKYARKLRADLASLPAGTSHAILGGIKSKLAKAELNLGNESEAIRLLTECDTIHLGQISAEWPVEQTRALAVSLRFDLGVAHLRLGETQNCCQQNTPDSCIMPIQGTGIHTNVAGSRNAIAYFSSVLKYSAKNSELHLRARWLLNIAYMTLGAHPAEVPKEHLIPLEKLMPGEPFPRFTNIASKVGLATYSLSGGVIADDFNNDGYLDLMVSSYDPNGQIRYFQNDQNGKFTDRTKEAGLIGILGGLNLVQADFDNDGDQDIFEQMGGGYPADPYYDALFENPQNDHHWITLQLVGTKSNRSAIGSRIRIDIVEDGKARSIYPWVNSGGSFGANPLKQNIGLGKATAIIRLEVYWPTSDITQRWTKVPMDKTIRITEEQNLLEDLPLKKFSLSQTFDSN